MICFTQSQLLQPDHHLSDLMRSTYVELAIPQASKLDKTLDPTRFLGKEQRLGSVLGPLLRRGLYIFVATGMNDSFMEETLGSIDGWSPLALDPMMIMYG
jgi:hypothetical protein